MHTFPKILMAVAGLLTVTPVFAQDCDAPCLGYAVSAEIQGDWLVSAKPSENKGSDIEPTIDLETTFVATETLSLVAILTAESVTDREPGEDRAFKDLGLYLSELYVDVDLEPVALRVGRFSPLFSLAADQLSGINVEGFASDYDTDDRLGAEAVMSFGGFDSSQAVTASVFTTDRSEVGKSIGAERELITLEDGGAGNASGVGSAAIFYDYCLGAEIDECFTGGEYGVRLGIRYQGKGDATEEQIADEVDPQDELGLLATASRSVPLAGDSTLSFLGEMAYFQNFEGEESDAVIGTASMAYDKGSVVYVASYSHRLNRPVDEADITSQFIALGTRHQLGETGYLGNERWLFETAYNYVDIADEETGHFISLKLILEFEG